DLGALAADVGRLEPVACDEVPGAAVAIAARLHEQAGEIRRPVGQPHCPALESPAYLADEVLPCRIEEHLFVGRAPADEADDPGVGPVEIECGRGLVLEERS